MSKAMDPAPLGTPIRRGWKPAATGVGLLLVAVVGAAVGLPGRAPATPPAVPPPAAILSTAITSPSPRPTVAVTPLPVPTPEVADVAPIVSVAELRRLVDRPPAKPIAVIVSVALRPFECHIPVYCPRISGFLDELGGIAVATFDRPNPELALADTSAPIALLVRPTGALVFLGHVSAFASVPATASNRGPAAAPGNFRRIFHAR